MSTFRRGLVQQPPQAPSKDVGKTATVVGRQLPKKPEPPPQPERSRIITEDKPRGVNVQFQTQHVRGLIVDGSGKPIRGLSPGTIAAHKAQTEDCTELCTRCGEMRPPAQMKTVVGNAENPNNPVRICAIECIPVAFKNPFDDRQKWQPSVPSVRFDRERGSPYDARAAGVSIRDLVTKDTYHNEKEVEPEFRRDHDYGQGQRVAKDRVGHAPSRESLEASRARIARR